MEISRVKGKKFMNCPFCRHSKTETYNTRKTSSGKQVWRRRRCVACKETFTSYERVDLSFITLIKGDGRQEPYVRSKLFASIYAACDQLPQQAETVDALADTIELKILDLKETLLATADLAEIALSTLKAFNTGAFVRYLSFRTNLISSKQLQSELKKFA